VSPGLISGAVALGKELIGMSADDQKRDDELELAIVQASGQFVRIASLAYLMGPELAPLLPYITAADVATYQDQVVDSVAAWKQGALQAAILGIWGKSEVDQSKARRARAERARRGQGSDADGQGDTAQPPRARGR